MTSLSETVATVQEGVDRFTGRTEIARQLRQLDAIDESADRLLALLNGVEEMLSVARGTGFAPNLEEAQDILEAAQKIAHAESDEGGLESAQRYLSSATEKVQAADARLVQSWRDYVSAQLPPLEGLTVLADTFSSVEAARTEAGRLKSALREARNLASERPSADTVRLLGELQTELPEVLQRLVGDDPNVRTFANELARGGASIAALTPQVLDWMERSGFNESFKVVAGRPADPTVR